MERGDILVHINVWTPQDLTKEEKLFLKKHSDSESFTPNPKKSDEILLN